ncbi:uncharacterized protein LOC118443144 [Vespa mandarinia]|uniref:uncharacterized protein LOC118443144 n=1 Tax=Vespa mandarinia TaxID=7446 RepID=UPI001617AFB2|nr:uncharacterized protein LOC118443144 [Vespa mandarinia]
MSIKDADEDDNDYRDTVVCKEDEMKNENFIYNDLLVRALVQLFPREESSLRLTERSLIHLWLEKLKNIHTDNTEELSNRNNYMWLLLFVLQNGNLIEPFDEPPPIDELPPISDIVPAQMIEELISLPDINFPQTNWIISDTNVMDMKEAHSTGMPPHKFLEYQPRPVNGISCYFSIFSKPS